MENPVLFALAVLAILGIPGPTNSVLATAGAIGGIRRSLPLVAAAAAGYLIAILAYGLVLRPAIAATPGIAIALRIAMGLYLGFLAFRLWRSAETTSLAAKAVVTPARAFLTTLLNPKAIVIAFAVMPFEAHRVWPYVAAFLLLLAFVSTGWIAIGAAAGKFASSRGQGALVPRIGAAAIAVFAVVVLGQIVWK